MPEHEGLGSLLRKLFRPRGTPSPAESWIARRNGMPPEEVIREHFAAMAVHDLDWILATLCPERARLYNDPRTVDRQRQTVTEAKVLSIEPAREDVPLPAYTHRYRSALAFRVEYELKLVPTEQRRDPTLREGKDWAYYVLVTESRGKPWLIADWGR